ncbi:hypothetical protein GGF31_004555 [Allomyces arbusculus]|nr:hypothetical protein GGF31_004555 [Allomyces arbusculus]
MQSTHRDGDTSKTALRDLVQSIDVNKDPSWIKRHFAIPATVMYGLAAYAVAVTAVAIWAISAGNLFGHASTSLDAPIPTNDGAQAPGPPTTRSTGIDGVDNLAIWPRPRILTAPADTTRNAKVPLPVKIIFDVAGSDATAVLLPAIDRAKRAMFPCSNPESFVSEAQGDSTTPTTTNDAGTTIRIVVRSPDTSLTVATSEKYSIDISAIDNHAVGVTLAASTVYGALRGLETLAQVVQPIDASALDVTVSARPFGDSNGAITLDMCGGGYVLQAAPLSIVDWPRFQHRGFLLDTARHFYPVPVLLKLLDGMAATKLNVFHFHLIDSQAFPVALANMPSLAAKGALSPAETYSETDILKVVEYAKLRGIRVIPEWDVPGHTYALSRAFPEIETCPNAAPFWQWGASPPTGQLDPTNDKTYEVLDAIIDRSAKLFPDAYAHIGHDEINAKCWSQLAAPNAAKGDIAALVRHFHDRLRPSLQSHWHDRKVVVWEEPFAELKIREHDSIFHAVQVWTASKPDLVRDLTLAGKQVIQSPASAWYLDCGHGAWVTNGGLNGVSTNSWCPYRPWFVMYDYEPTLDNWHDAEPGWDATVRVPDAGVLGGEACLWSEQVDASNVETRAFPRLLAVAERLWAHPGIDAGTNVGSAIEQRDRVAQRLHVARRALLLRRGIRAEPVQPGWCEERVEFCR